MKRILSSLLFLSMLSASIFASPWDGYEKTPIQIEDREGYVIAPERALAGNPWVWRARFPNWHAEIDQALLKKGYHIAYMDVTNLFGSPKAIAYWDAFYAHMLEQGFSEKVVLEGVSRGGLIALNWAKKNPEKVSCIYLEVPVCDIRSWPGGKGSGVGGTNEWLLAQEAYEMNEAQLMQWRDNPVDNLEALALSKTPIYCAIGLNDKIVPPAENTFILSKRYIELGGPIMIHPMTQGEQALQGHQFPIETPEKIVDFIISHSSPDKQKEWFELRGGLENARMVFTRTGKGRVAFLGGSITANPGWRNMVCDELQRRFPDTEFEFIAAGIPSTGSPMGAYRLHRDVLSKGPIDLLFEEAAVNDSSIGHSDQEQQNAMEGIVRHARESNPEMDIILMHFVDPTKMKEYNAGKVPAVITNHESVAIHYNIPSINLALEVTDRINLGEFTWKDDFKNLHPSPFGQKLYFNTINRLFNAAWPGEPAEDDKVTVHPLPEKLYSGCYNNGQFLSPTVVTDLKGFKQDPNWKNKDEANTRPGFVDVPMLVGENPGDEFSLTFNGNAIGLMIAAGPDAGTIEFKIDNGEWTEINLFTKWSRGLHLPRLHMLTSDLEDKAHLLTVRISDKKHKVSTGHACRIAYIAINGTLADEQ